MFSTSILLVHLLGNPMHFQRLAQFGFHLFIQKMVNKSRVEASIILFWVTLDLQEALQEIFFANLLLPFDGIANVKIHLKSKHC